MVGLKPDRDRVFIACFVNVLNYEFAECEYILFRVHMSCSNWPHE